MKKDNLYLTGGILILILFCLLIIAGIVFSILSIIQNGLKSYGTIVIATIAIIVIIWVTTAIIKKHSPGSKPHQFFKELLGEFIVGIIDMLSTALP